MCEKNTEVEKESKEELLKKIRELKNKLNEIEKKPKTSEAQLRATKKYLKAHPGILKDGQKRYYEKKSQDPEWVLSKNKLRNERYHKKKNELKELEKNKELINYVTA